MSDPSPSKATGIVQANPRKHVQHNAVTQEFSIDSLNGCEDEADRIKQRNKYFNLIRISTTSIRLRYILHQLDRGELPVADLKKNLEYAALVLETAYMDETRRICEEDDDDLSEVSPDSVPEEVREWLTSTFTRQVAMKPIRRFKSVANAIRTGIMFDK